MKKINKQDSDDKEKVKYISWWEDPKNKDFFNLPIAVIKDEDYWVASTNTATEKFLSNYLIGCAKGKTKEEAINKMFNGIKRSYEYSEECRLNYQRWVPFRKGDWSHVAGKWFVIFGMQFSFRWNKGIRGGKYIPFTNINIWVTNQWTLYNDWKLKNKK